MKIYDVKNEKHKTWLICSWTPWPRTPINVTLLSHKLLERKAMQSAQYMYNKARSQLGTSVHSIECLVLYNKRPSQVTRRPELVTRHDIWGRLTNRGSCFSHLPKTWQSMYISIFVTIRDYSSLFATFRHYSPLFVTIRYYSSLFVTIRDFSRLFAAFGDYSGFITSRRR